MRNKEKVPTVVHAWKGRRQNKKRKQHKEQKDEEERGEETRWGERENQKNQKKSKLKRELICFKHLAEQGTDAILSSLLIIIF